MWLEWIEDETKILDTDSAEAQKYILSLYVRALQDFHYPKISTQFLEFSENLFVTGILDLQKVRENFETTIAVLGYDYEEGGKYWMKYLEFEQALPEEQQEEDRIRIIFQKWLSIPNNDLGFAWDEYDEWEKNLEEKEKQEQIYKQSDKMMSQFTSYAEEFAARIKLLEQSNDIEPLIEHLGEPLLALDKNEFSYVQVYYERVLSEYLLNKTLWQKYTSYAMDICPQANRKLQILGRALKNVQDEWQIWLQYVNLLERSDSSFDIPKMELVVEQALTQGSEGGGIRFTFEMLKALMEFVVRLQFAKGVQPDQEVVRDVFLKCQETLQRTHPKQEERFKLTQYLDRFLIWLAEIESLHFKSGQQVQENMNKYLKGKKAQKAQNWLYFVKLMKQADQENHHKSVRGIYKRSLNTLKEDKILVAQEWLDWEKKFGGLDQTDEAIKFLKKLNLYQKIISADQSVPVAERHLHQEKRPKRQEPIPEREQELKQSLSPPPELQKFTAKTQAIKITPELVQLLESPKDADFAPPKPFKPSSKSEIKFVKQTKVEEEVKGNQEEP